MIDTKAMLGDNHTVVSDHDSVDTSATCRMDYFDGRSQIDENDYGNSNQARDGPVNNRLSLEARRQDELKSQSIVNALNRFILQAGDIYKGNKLSTPDENRLRQAANEAGVSTNVVDALIQQTANQNAIVEYCMTSDDVFARKMKEDPQLSQVLNQKDQDNLEKGRGLNVSNSVWRIFMHKIIKQFLKEQNMQLTDIIKQSSHTRRLYEETLRIVPGDNKFDATRLPRDYSEERKHVFIPEDEAKQARIEATEAMTKLQQYRNPYDSYLVNGTSIQSHPELPPLVPQNHFEILDSRDDDLSMAPCPSEWGSVFVERIEHDKRSAPFVNPIDNPDALFYATNQDSLSSGTSMLPSEAEREHLFIERIQKTTDTTLHLDITEDLDGIPCPPEQDDLSIRVERLPGTIDTEMPSEQKTISPSTKEFDRERSDEEFEASPRTPERKVLQPITRNSISESNATSAVKRRIAKYEKGPVSPDLPLRTSGKLEQQSFPSGNVLQARAIFEKKDKHPESDAENEKGSSSSDLIERKIGNGNVLQAKALFEKKDEQPEESVSPDLPQRKIGNGNVLQAKALFEKKDEQPEGSISPDLPQRKIGNGNVLQAKALFEKKDEQPRADVDQSRKRTNKNIQHVLATWTQKEQENPLPSTQKDPENDDVVGNPTETARKDISKEYPSVVERAPVEDEIDFERFPKLDTTPLYEERIKHTTNGCSDEEEMKIGEQQVLVSDVQVSEYNLKQRSLFKKFSRKKLPDNVDPIEVYHGDDVGFRGKYDGENQLPNTNSSLNHSPELTFADRSEKIEEEGGTGEVFDDNDKSNNDDNSLKQRLLFKKFSRKKLPDNTDPIVMHHGDVGSRDRYDSENDFPHTNLSLNHSPQVTSTDRSEKIEESENIDLTQTTASIAQTKPSTKTIIPHSGRTRWTNPDRDVFDELSDIKTDLKPPVFVDKFKCDNGNFNQNEIFVTENDGQNALTYTGSPSENSCRIPTPPRVRVPTRESTTVEAGGSDRHPHNGKQKYYNGASVAGSACDSDSHENVQVRDEFESNKNLRDECDKQLQPKRVSGYRDKTERESHLRFEQNMVGPTERATYPFEKNSVDQSTWANFESKNSFREAFKNPEVPHDKRYDTEGVQNAKYEGTSQDRVQSLKAFNHFSYDDSTKENSSISTKEARVATKSNRLEKRMANSASKAPTQNFQVLNNADFAPFDFGPSPKRLIHKNPKDASASVRKIKKMPSVEHKSRPEPKNSDPNQGHKGKLSNSIEPKEFFATFLAGESSSWPEKASNGQQNVLSEPKEYFATFLPRETSCTTEEKALCDKKKAVNEPKDFFASFLASDSSSTLEKNLRDEQRMIGHKLHKLENSGHFSARMGQISLQGDPFTETNFQIENQPNSWETFTSTFDSKSQDDCDRNDVSTNEGTSARFYTSAKYSHQPGPVQSLSSINDMSQQRAEREHPPLHLEERLYNSEVKKYDNRSGVVNANEFNTAFSEEKAMHPTMPIISSRHESVTGVSQERFNVVPKDSDVYVEAGKTKKTFDTANQLSRNDNCKTLSIEDQCITLSDSHSILEHDQGIRSFLEQRGDAPEESVQDHTHEKNFEQMDDISEERNHLEALSVFLTAYRLDERHRGSTSEEGSGIASREANGKINNQNYSKNPHAMKENSHETTAKDSDRKASNATMDFDDKVSDASSEMNRVDTTADHAEAGRNGLNSPNEVCWPVEETNGDVRVSLCSNTSEPLQPDQFSNEEEDATYQLRRPRVKHRKSISSINDDITKDKYSESQLDPTECQQQARNEFSYRQGRAHRDPVVRILDRPLLDLDDEDCFDAIEVERQESNDDSWFPESESRTVYSSNSRSYQMDPKPDPLPDPSPKGSRKLSPEGSRRLSYTNPDPKNAREAPEGATEEELKLLNHFIDVASSNFGGNTLSADSESRVRAAALKVGLTEKFVDQLLNQTIKRENPSSRLSFVPSEQPPPAYEKDYVKNNDYSMHLERDGSNFAANEYGGDNVTNDDMDYSQRRRGSERRRHESTPDNCSAWDSLGKTFGLLANMTARACGMEYHTSRRDDASSVVSAISWEDDNAGPKVRRGKRERQSLDTTEAYAPGYLAAHRHENDNDKTQHVTFASNVEVEGETKGQESNTLQNDLATPPRPKITQLV